MSEIFTPQNGEQSRDERQGLVLDTNTVLALWMFRDPALDRLREWIEAGNCRLYSRADALEELRRVLAYRQFGLNTETQKDIFASYSSRVECSSARSNAAIQNSLILVPRCRDRDDQKFLQLASEQKANLLLTRDKALLALKKSLMSKTGCSITKPESLSDALEAREGQRTALNRVLKIASSPSVSGWAGRNRL